MGDFIISMPLRLWINDGSMALFFLMVSLEIKRESLIGELASVSRAMCPSVASLAGMIGPAPIYIALHPDNLIGFGI
ncbi:Na+/H+ antiporter NhaA, partial [Aliarcobacter butzleri]